MRVHFIISTSILLCLQSASAGTLNDWDETGNGSTVWDGWSYSTEMRGLVDREGWKSDLNIKYGPLYGPETFRKNDNHYESDDPFDNTARIVDGYEGKGFKVYSRVVDDTYHPAWWLWYTAENLLSYGRGVVDTSTDRMSFYLYLNDVQVLTKDGGSDSLVARSFTVGTYGCWEEEGINHCVDGEGPGNQHYYHYVLVDEGSWWHVQLDRPQHRREGATDELPVGPDPTATLGGPTYFGSLSEFYAEINYDMARSQGSYYLIDEINFWNQTEAENEKIASVAVGYNPTTDKWGISFHDMAFHDAGIPLNADTHSTFEVRYSTSPITASNYTSAVPIAPEYYAGSTYTGSDNGYIRRAKGWGTIAWTQFELPDNLETAGNTLYFAIKDMSDTNGNKGTTWPWNDPDGRNAVVGVKTISYKINLLYKNAPSIIIIKNSSSSSNY